MKNNRIQKTPVEIVINELKKLHTEFDQKTQINQEDELLVKFIKIIIRALAIPLAILVSPIAIIVIIIAFLAAL